MITKKQRLFPSGKAQAERVNHGTINKDKGFATNPTKNLKMKVSCFNQLKRGKTVGMRKEINAEWRDGHRLIRAGLVTCELLTDCTMYIKANKPMTKEYEMQLARCLKGNTFT